MELHTVYAAYFSPTGTTRRAVCALADTLAAELDLARRDRPFTLPQQREEPLCFGPGDLVVFGTPVYAGRVPNVLTPYLSTIQGEGAIAVPVVSYGNRDMDDALIELRDMLTDGGLRPVAGVASVGEHAFSGTLAAGRPDAADQRTLCMYGKNIAEKVRRVSDPASLSPLEVEGVPHPYRGYYQPRGKQGEAIDIRKVRPLTNDRCIDCKLCAELCPMGAIDHGDIRHYLTICIKCGACVKHCPTGAKYYTDENYLYHKADLEKSLPGRAETKLFL